MIKKQKKLKKKIKYNYFFKNNNLKNNNYNYFFFFSWIKKNNYNFIKNQKNYLLIFKKKILYYLLKQKKKKYFLITKIPKIYNIRTRKWIKKFFFLKKIYKQRKKSDKFTFSKKPGIKIYKELFFTLKNYNYLNKYCLSNRKIKLQQKFMRKTYKNTKIIFLFLYYNNFYYFLKHNLSLHTLIKNYKKIKIQKKLQKLCYFIKKKIKYKKKKKLFYYFKKIYYFFPQFKYLSFKKQKKNQKLKIKQKIYPFYYFYFNYLKNYYFYITKNIKFNLKNFNYFYNKLKKKKLKQKFIYKKKRKIFFFKKRLKNFLKNKKLKKFTFIFYLNLKKKKNVLFTKTIS
jgi:hypothetical protein